VEEGEGRSRKEQRGEGGEKYERGKGEGGKRIGEDETTRRG
jgi:hypothetical protein